ncbi:O-methyltransferase [Poronia punctata]|nr:O-methyltransferase [Poronia punctata]
MSTIQATANPGGRQRNETWAAVDAYTLQRVHPPSKTNHQALQHALSNSRAKGLPNIGTAPTMAKMYALQCKANKTRHALELGTLGGYTSIWLASENPDLHVTTIEINPHHAAVARENVAQAPAGVEARVDIRLGAGLDILPVLRREIEAGEKERLGFVYIDADKENNWNYVDLVIPLCEKGAVIYVDNIAQNGKLVDPERQDEMTLGARKVVEMAGKDERIDAVVFQFVGEKGYDGMLMAVVR